MANRATAVKPTYKPIKNDELKPIAEIYKGMVTATGVLVLFTAKDADVDAGWVTDFGDAITAVGNVVPSRTIIQTNRDITASIKLNSKKSVVYGKILTYYLNKAFKGQTGLINSFPIVKANKKMRLGDTEGFLFEVNTIIQQLTVAANQAALVAKGWQTSNLTDYQNLETSVDALNTQQELAKKFVPENTDAATVIRNDCYGFIQTLVELKDIVYDTDKQKKHDWAISTNLNQIRAAGGGGGTILVKEGDLAMGVIGNVDIGGITPTALTNVLIEVSGPTRLYGSPSPAVLPGGVFFDVPGGSVTKTAEEFATLIGLNATNTFLNVQNIGAGIIHWKLTFDHLA